MAARQGKDPLREETPPEIASNPPVYRGTSPGFDFYLQSMCEVQKSVGSIESSIKYLRERDQAYDTKLDDLSNDLHNLAKEVYGAKKVAWIIGGICSAIGAIGLVFLKKILDVAVAYFLR